MERLINSKVLLGKGRFTLSQMVQRFQIMQRQNMTALTRFGLPIADDWQSDTKGSICS